MFLLRLASTISSLALIAGASLAAAAPTSDDPEAPPAATSPAVPYELIVPERGDRQSTATQIHLGHSKIENTVRFLGIDVEDALALAENTEI